MIGETIQSSAHYLLWYAKDKERIQVPHLISRNKLLGADTGDHYTRLETHRRAN